MRARASARPLLETETAPILQAATYQLINHFDLSQGFAARLTAYTLRKGRGIASLHRKLPRVSPKAFVAIATLALLFLGKEQGQIQRLQTRNYIHISRYTTIDCRHSRIHTPFHHKHHTSSPVQVDTYLNTQFCYVCFHFTPPQ